MGTPCLGTPCLGTPGLGTPGLGTLVSLVWVTLVSLVWVPPVLSGYVVCKAFRNATLQLAPQLGIPTRSINYSLLGARLSMLSSRSKTLFAPESTIIVRSDSNH